MSDALAHGRRYRVFNVVDTLSRQGLASEVDTSLPAARVIRTLEEIAQLRGYPARILLDNGPEFRSVVSMPGVRTRRRAGVHPAQQAESERGEGELQRADARRAAEPALVAEPR